SAASSRQSAYATTRPYREKKVATYSFASQPRIRAVSSETVIKLRCPSSSINLLFSSARSGTSGPAAERWERNVPPSPAVTGGVSGTGYRAPSGCGVLADLGGDGRTPGCGRHDAYVMSVDASLRLRVKKMRSLRVEPEPEALPHLRNVVGGH